MGRLDVVCEVLGGAMLRERDAQNGIPADESRYEMLKTVHTPCIFCTRAKLAANPAASPKRNTSRMAPSEDISASAAESAACDTHTPHRSRCTDRAKRYSSAAARGALGRCLRPARGVSRPSVECISGAGCTAARIDMILR